MEPIISTLADIKKAISSIHDAINKATAQQKLIQDQYTKAKTESQSAHEDALKAAWKSDHHLAMQALYQEVVQEKFANLLQSHIKEQIAVVELLNNHLTTLNEVKVVLEKYNDDESTQYKNTQSLNTFSFGENVSEDLDNKEQLSEYMLVERVKKVISEQSLIEIENINLDHSLVVGIGQCFGSFWSSSDNYNVSPNDLNMDDQDTIELFMAIEEEFDIEFSDSEIEMRTTVQELVNMISFKLNQTQIS